MLHIISHTPCRFDHLSFLRTLSGDDVVLFVQDGVSGAVRGHSFLAVLTEKCRNVYVLQNDMEARGLGKIISADVKLINYNQYVELTAKYIPQLLW